MIEASDLDIFYLEDEGEQGVELHLHRVGMWCTTDCVQGLWVRQARRSHCKSSHRARCTFDQVLNAIIMSSIPPVAAHAVSLLARSTRSSFEENLPSSPGTDGKTQFLRQDEKEEDVEKAEVPPAKEEKKQGDKTRFFLWIVVNTLATICIVGCPSRHASCINECRYSRTKPSSRTLSFD